MSVGVTLVPETPRVLIQLEVSTALAHPVSSTTTSVGHVTVRTIDNLLLAM